MPLTPEQIRTLATGSLATNRVSNPALRRGDGAAGEEAGIFETLLDYAGRPYSAVAGTVVGLQQGSLEAAGANVFDALAGDTRFGTIDILGELGIDTDSKAAKTFSLISDIGILGALDPLNYLTFGTNKLGRVAKLTGTLPATRVERAQSGLSAIANFGGQRLPFTSLKLPQVSTPRVANVAFARAQDAIGGAISSRTPEGLKALFRSRRALELANPKESDAIKGIVQTFENQFTEGNTAIRAGSKGVSAQTQRRAALFTEAPEVADTGLLKVPLSPKPEAAGAAMHASLIGRQADIETKLRRMEDGNFLFPDEVQRSISFDPELARRAEYVTEETAIGKARQSLIVRIEDQETFIKGFVDDAGEFTGKAADRADFDKAREFLMLEKTHLLEMGSRVRQLDPAKAPIQEYGNQLRLILIAERDQIAKVLEGGTASDTFKEAMSLIARDADDRLQVGYRMMDLKTTKDVKFIDEFGKNIRLDKGTQSLMNVIQPISDDATEIYMSRVRKIVPDAQPPIDNFLPHYFASKFGGIYRKNAKNIKQKAKERAKRQMLNGPIKDPELLDEMAELVAGGGKSRTRSGLGFTTREMKGDFDTLKHRRLRFTAAGIGLSDLGYGFENRMAWMVNQQLQDATKWGTAYDAHKWMADQHGITAKAFAALDPQAKKGFASLEFHVPYVPAAKQPFAGNVYIPTEMKKLMGQMISHTNEFTTDEGFRALLDTLHSVRRIWSSWTLAPFPAFHARNLVSQGILMRQAGVDLKTKEGRDFLRGSTEMLQHNKLAKMMRFGAGPIGSTQNATNVAEMLAKKFDDPNITEEFLVLMARRQDLIKHHWRRDTEIIDAIEGGLESTGRIESFSEMAKTIFKNPLKPEQHGLIRFGYNNIGQPIEDIPRFTVFLHALNESADAGADLERSLRNATAHTREFLGDPSPKTLSAFESDILKAGIPFYQWSRFNIPQQLKLLGTRPDLLAPYYRAYNGAMNNFEGEFEMQDAPDWLRKNLGMPIFWVTDADGTKKISIWNHQGFIPLSEINEIADFLRGPSGAGKALFGKLAPWFKEPLEQMLNVDAFRERELRSGQTKDIFGITMPDWTQHILLNIRLFSEFDRLNPLDAWTELGRWRGSFTKERPHRLEAPQAERWLRFFTGYSTFAIDPNQELLKKMRDRTNKMDKAMGAAARASARGQIDERDSFYEVADRAGDQFAALRDRLSKRREDNALRMAASEAARNPQ